MLNKRFDEINFYDAKSDVIQFIKDKRKLDLWDKDFFKEVTNKLEARN